MIHELIHLPEKRPRKKWTHEETQNLVRGCNKVRHFVILLEGSPFRGPRLSLLILTFHVSCFSCAVVHGMRECDCGFHVKWGVGNWKAILKDPELVFDNRSPVDLKDRSV